MEIGSNLDIRGVFSDVTYSANYLSIPGFALENHVSHIGMIAGGTGITPCYQIIKHSLASKSDKTVISLVYSNSTADDILLKDELVELAKNHPDRFKVHFTVTQSKEPVEGWSQRRIDDDMIKNHLEAPANNSARSYVLVCGPSAFSDKAKMILSNLDYKYSTLLGMPNKYPEAPTNVLGKLHRKSPHTIYWIVSFLVIALIWSFSRGKIGFNGRFCVEGFKNERNATRYAYRIINNPDWATGAITDDKVCDFDPLVGQIISWALYIPHQVIQWWIIYKA